MDGQAIIRALASAIEDLGALFRPAFHHYPRALAQRDPSPWPSARYCTRQRSACQLRFHVNVTPRWH